MKVLVVSTLYPNRAQPVHALFVEQRIRAMARRFPVRVLCPIPSFPFASRLGRYAHRSEIPDREERHGVDVRYPRFLSIPKFLKPLDGPFLWLALRRTARTMRAEFAFDRIDAHLAYPDGWAAVRLGRSLDIPVSVTIRGHDLNDLPRYPVRGRQVAWTLRRADAVFAVAEALREAAIGLGADPSRVRTVPNGVDAEFFRPQPRREARAALGLETDGKLLLSVGHLVERKGFHHVLAALPRVARTHPDVRLAIVGGPGEEGNFEAPLRRIAAASGVTDRVIFAGAVRHEELPAWYAAADVFCLASAKEGRPNVILEALASGIPVVATRVWGTPELIAEPSLGILVDSVEESVLGDALVTALGRTWNPETIAAHGRRFRWEATAERVEEVLRSLDRSRGGK
jgi:glycosyltransferase involved in cell wall biosynthesis